MNKHNHNCHHCHSHEPCGCNKPHIIGCPDKVDLLCTNYTSDNLLPLNIQTGDTGEVIVKKINEFIKNLVDSLEIDPTLIESIGGKIPIYNGLSPAMVHEIKSIQGQPNGGVIVENIEGSQPNCAGDTDYINVRIDEEWLINFLNQWILTVDLCALTAGCTPQPEHNPVTTNIVKTLGNRGVYTFTSADFTSHFTDNQGHALASITITGTVTGYTLNNTSYVAGTEISIGDIAGGALAYHGDNIDTAYTKTVTYRAKDSIGANSNNSSIIFDVAAKQFLVFTTPTVSLKREIVNSKTSSIGYSNGTGQIIPNGYVFVNQGTVGQPGYLKIMATSGVTLAGSGTIPILVDSLPTSTQANQTVPYVFDGSNGGVSLTYNSNPVTQDLVVNLPNRGTHTFTTAEFVAKYTDFDGDAMTEIKAEASVTNYLFNGTPYVAGTWIPVNNIDQLTYTGANQNDLYTQTTPWFAKDSQGNIST
jgi:hypothetical protein